MTAQRPTQDEFRTILWRAALPPLLLLAALAAFVCILLFHLLNANAAAHRADDIIAHSYDVERLLVNMETGIRGYKLSGAEEFLEPYNAARGKIDSAFKDLRDFFQKSPDQQKRVDNVEKSFDDWIKLEQGLNAEPLGKLDPAGVAILRQRKAMMDDMRLQLQQMIMAEADQRNQRDRAFEHATALAVFGSIGLSISLGIGLALLNRNTILRLTSVYQQAINAEETRAIELASSNKQFLDLAEAIPQLVWICDGQGKATYFNGNWGAFTGRTSQDLTDRGWEASLHPEDSETSIDRWKLSLKSGKPFEGEYRLKSDPEGSFRWFLCRAMPVRDQSGKNIRWFGTCTDIESQKKLEQERETMLAAERTARSNLLRSNLMKDQFLATLSHELRTPMTAILGWAQLLHDPEVRKESLDRAIEAIDTNARTQARLIEDLLDMSRILMGKLLLKFEPVDLRAVILAAIDAVSPAAGAKQVTIKQELPEAGNITPRGDSARLQQIVWNLLSNGVKFTPAGGVVTVALSRVGESARIVVSDTGRGINADFLPYVFDQFRQADGSTTRNQGGLGLGLAIVRHLAQMHGGTVAAASEGPGRGATFTVDIPLAAGATDVAMEEFKSPAVALGNRPVALQNLRVLLVEDERDTAVVVRTILERAGAKVELAHTGVEALTILRQREFDVLISDIGMPEMDGYALIRRLREMEGSTRRRTPAIAFTAFAHKEDRLEALMAGYQMHIAKPVAPNELTLAVAAVVAAAQG